MTRPDVDLDDYLAQVALSTATLVWADLAPRGVVVTVEGKGSGAVARRALLGDGDFSLDITEDVVDPAAGGGAVGRFAGGPYRGLLERQPDQVAYLLDPAGDTPGLALDARWCGGALPAPGTVDDESWAEYGFPRAIETVTLHKGGTGAAYGCLMPFGPGIVEAALLVERSARGEGAGRDVAESLFARAAAMDVWLHWATLASNPASQRLGRRRPHRHEARITTYTWA